MLCSENIDKNMTMNGEDFEEDVHDLLQLCVSTFAWSDREHPRKSSVRTIHDLVHISTRHHPNTSSPNYPYINYHSWSATWTFYSSFVCPKCFYQTSADYV